MNIMNEEMVHLVGTVIGSYTIHEHIANGSFGAVFKASHPLIQHPVVVKVLLSKHLQNPEAVTRFEEEANIIAQLGSKVAIVPLYDYWRDETGAYLVLKWLGGGTLRERIEKEGRLDPHQVLAILERLTVALTAMHRRSMIHRDLKPSNILFDEAGAAYLADFGISKQRDVNLTAPRTVLGTPAYLAPEQITSKPVTPRTDIYALGLLLYEMLMGEKPFEDKNPIKIMMKQINEPLPLVLMRDPKMQEGINAVLQKAAAKGADARYADVAELLAAMRETVNSASA